MPVSRTWGIDASRILLAGSQFPPSDMFLKRGKKSSEPVGEVRNIATLNSLGEILIFGCPGMIIDVKWRERADVHPIPRIEINR